MAFNVTATDITTSSTSCPRVLSVGNEIEAFFAFGVSGGSLQTFAGVTGLFQVSYDGTNYLGIAAVNMASGAVTNGGTTVTLTDSTAALWRVYGIQGMASVRFLSNAYTSGTCTCTAGVGVSGNGSPPALPPTLSTTAFSGTTGTFSGAVTAASLAVTAGLTSSGATGAGIGYATGAGGTVTQASSITTGVTLSKNTGTITTVSSTLTQNSIATFTVTNTVVAATDTVIATIKSYGGTAGGIPRADVTATAAGSFNITVKNIGATTLDNTIVINFAVIKGVAA